MKFGQCGQGNGELNTPTGIGIHSESTIYMTEWKIDWISIFTCEGAFLSSFDSKGSEPGQLNCPFGIAVDEDGVVYVMYRYIHV